MDIEKVLVRYELKAIIKVYVVIRSTEQSRKKLLEKMNMLFLKMEEALKRLDYEAYGSKIKEDL